MRYAYGGEPLWIREPEEVLSLPRPGRGGAKRQSGAGRREAAGVESAPRCESCGAARCFELQFMPSLSRYIEYAGGGVRAGDSRSEASMQTTAHRQEQSSSSAAAPLLNDEAAKGVDLLQMNMGVLAIWSCAESCRAGSREYCVFQPAI